MKPTVFIHVNDPQLLGAKVAAWSLRASARDPLAFDVRMLRLEETPHLLSREGQEFRRKGKVATWHNRDLQSFTPLRFLPPQATGFRGRALVIDPDVFALCDVTALLERDMGGKAILCKWCESYQGSKPFWATSVMLLDCAKLAHWRWNERIDALFRKEFDYGDWIALRLEPQESIGRLEEEWNHFDLLTSGTRLLHMTERSTQPWKTGLPVDFDTMYHAAGDRPPPPQLAETKERAAAPPPRPPRPPLLAQLAAKLGFTRGPMTAPTAPGRETAPVARSADPPRYLEHPDPEQERLFFTILRGALEDGFVTDAELEENVRRRFLRPDARELLARLEPFDLDGFRAGRWNRPPRAAAAGAGT
jgi:hypothetical protein